MRPPPSLEELPTHNPCVDPERAMHFVALVRASKENGDARPGYRLLPAFDPTPPRPRATLAAPVRAAPPTRPAPPR